MMMMMMMMLMMVTTTMTTIMMMMMMMMQISFRVLISMNQSKAQYREIVMRYISNKKFAGYNNNNNNNNNGRNGSYFRGLATSNEGDANGP